MYRYADLAYPSLFNLPPLSDIVICINESLIFKEHPKQRKSLTLI